MENKWDINHICYRTDVAMENVGEDLQYYKMYSM